MSQPQIRFPAGDPRLADWNRNIERAIKDAVDEVSRNNSRAKLRFVVP